MFFSENRCVRLCMCVVACVCVCGGDWGGGCDEIVQFDNRVLSPIEGMLTMHVVFATHRTS